jgi:hypothetical protein
MFAPLKSAVGPLPPVAREADGTALPGRDLTCEPTDLLRVIFLDVRSAGTVTILAGSIGVFLPMNRCLEDCCDILVAFDAELTPDALYVRIRDGVPCSNSGVWNV